jgi:outer membrane lipase/esterase
MRKYNLAATLLVAIVLAGCGGGGSSGGSQTPKVSFTSEVTFGDSLSDVGTYAVPTITAYGGGGQYTINGTGKNWTELMAAQLGLPAPCAAETGLNGTVFGVGVTITPHPGCYNYAQGGARVTIPYGPGNVALASLNAGYGQLGQLTVPITTQIDNHLAAVGGKFSGSEIVFVLAGANDVLIQLGSLQAGATTAATAAVTAAVPAQITADINAGTCLPANATTTCVSVAAGELTPTVGAAAALAYIQANAATALTAIVTAATELTGYVNGKIIGNGAKYVVVINMPDVSSTPAGAAADAALPGMKSMINTLVTTFNSQLQAGLANNPNVLFVDAYTVHRDEVANPAAYSLSNVTTPACNLTATTNPIGSSLMCNATNLSPGVDSHYLFSDTVHPTPYGYLLLARLVSKDMLIKGWL